MRRRTAIATAVVAAVLMTAATHIVAQDNAQEVTDFTFSGPVEMPNLTLPAGTYTFRLADSPMRNVVQVLSKDDHKMLGQFLFVPAGRLEPSDDTIVTFKESSAGTSPAIQYWFYPGRTIGKEFVYPKNQAQRIAARTHGKVYASDGDKVIDESGTLARVPAAANPVTSQAGAGTQAREIGRSRDTASDTAQAASAAPTNQVPVGTSGQNQIAANELPHTASSVALTGFVGMVSLLGGLGVRAARQSL